MAAEVALVMFTPESTSCTLAVSSVSTMTIPLFREPERIYTPSSRMVTVLPLISTEAEVVEILWSDRVIYALVSSS